MASEGKQARELVVEKFANELHSKVERLANETSNCFTKIEDRIYELALHFSRIHNQLHILCKVTSSPNLNTCLSCLLELYRFMLKLCHFLLKLHSFLLKFAVELSNDFIMSSKDALALGIE